jgi:hypothetical protein
MKANLDPIMNKPGPYVFKVSHSIYHFVANESQTGEKTKQYSHLYFLNTLEETSHRLSNPYNKLLNAEVYK